MNRITRRQPIAQWIFITCSIFANFTDASEFGVTQQLRISSSVSGAVGASQPTATIQSKTASPVGTQEKTNKTITQPDIRPPTLTPGAAQSLNPQLLPLGGGLIKPMPGANIDMAKPRIDHGIKPTKHFSGLHHYDRSGAAVRHISVLPCGGQDQVCCGPPVSQRSNIYPPYCNKTLGCNVVTNKCERPCGKPGQVCCDGPDTVAPKEGYSPNSPLLGPMCVASICDGAKRRCVADCGMNAGDSCCRPNPPLAVASCINRSLECEFDDVSSETGVCLPCGLNGIKPCAGTRCAEKLTLGPYGLCVPCGSAGLEPCQGRTCDPGLVYYYTNKLCEDPNVVTPNVAIKPPKPVDEGKSGAPSPPTNPPPKCECTPQSTDSACGIEIGSTCTPAGPSFCRPGLGCTRDSGGSLPYRCRPPDAFEASKWNCPRLPNESCWTKEQAKTFICY